MGVYDSVLVPCPKCGEKQYFQTKSGDCLLEVYELNECPPDVLRNVNRHSPYDCEKCGTKYYVDMYGKYPIPIAWEGQPINK